MNRKTNSIPKPQALLTLPAVGLLFVAGLFAQSPAVVAKDAWARVPAPSKMETAAYMVLENRGSERRSVVSASSDSAEKVEMHEMKLIKSEKPAMNMGKSMDKAADKPADNSMMAMTPLSEIAIPAKGKTELMPNGIHLMLFGLKTRPAPGDTLTVTLNLDDGTTVPVQAKVRN